MRRTWQDRRAGITWIGTLIVGVIGAVTILVARRLIQIPEAGGETAAAQVLILGMAAAVAAWYADETRRMADEAFEARKLALRPHVYLMQDRTDGGKRDRYHVHAHNAGPGVAYEVRVAWCCPEPQDGPEKLGRLCPTEDSKSISGGSHDGAVLIYSSEFGDEFKWRYRKHTTAGDDVYWYPE